MFKVKKLDISVRSGGYRVMLLKADADTLGLKVGDRVKIGYKNPKSSRSKMNYLICDLGIVDSTNRMGNGVNVKLKIGDIGVYKDVFEKFSMNNGDPLVLMPAPKPVSLEYVRLKFNGKIKLKESHFKEIVNDIVLNKYSDVETTFFVLACSAHPLDDSEVIGLTRAMVDAGKHLTFKSSNGVIMDKHCIGGIPGNRTTMLVIPMVAAAGLTIPKTSSRSITSPSGTADTMEVLANVSLSLSEMHHVVSEIGGCVVWGGALDLSPADDAIINVEHPLEIDTEGQMLASILSKKKSAGSTHVVIDIPMGKTAKVKSRDEALRLKKRFVRVGRAIGLKIDVLITDGSQPVGRGIGPYLEAQDVLKVLSNDSDQPFRLRDKAIKICGHMFEMAGIVKKGAGVNYAREILDSGKAKEKFDQILDAQGRKDDEGVAKHSGIVKASETGVLKEINNKFVSQIAFILGCPKDKAAGLYLRKRVGDRVEKGEVICDLFSNSKLKLKYAKTFVESESPFRIK